MHYTAMCTAKFRTNLASHLFTFISTKCPFLWTMKPFLRCAIKSFALRLLPKLCNYMKRAGVRKIVARLCGRALFAAEIRAPARRQSCHMHVFDAQKPASITLVWSICRPEKSDILVKILLTFVQ